MGASAPALVSRHLSRPFATAAGVAIAVLAFAFADGADLHISAFLFAGGHVFECHGCLLWLERGGNNLTHGFVIVKAAPLGFGDAIGAAVEFKVVSEVCAADEALAARGRA